MSNFIAKQSDVIRWRKRGKQNDLGLDLKETGGERWHYGKEHDRFDTSGVIAPLISLAARIRVADTDATRLQHSPELSRTAE